MTFYHFVNCLLLTFGPPVILYRFSVISEYGTLMRVLTGALSYILTQMSKMLIIAGLVNLTEFWEHLIDCIGLYYSMVHYQKASVASVKILSTALGWTVTESIFTRLVNFYINARSLQFDWHHLIDACGANIDLVQNICLCSLLWYWNRKSNKLYLAMIIGYILAISFTEFNIIHRTGMVMAFSIASMAILNVNEK
ncbi:BOS complex subunit TMEM147 [Dermatophagoides farinae]|uniref:BOS complex subunit TMEM147 n=1 Tax=Dermatophagoides farinae TaxID=6954 RepID=A0A922L880_DERFA|nr:transmembrane protein 147-like [Dermatophagoides farinae]KAH7640395.1 transmembrane protein-like protein [Dermatophagoides farinae]KAH9521292.1 hypothetical protein DERF_004961 [Dermatophagoides farinae]